MKLGFSHLDGIKTVSEVGKGSTFSFIIENKKINIETEEIEIG
jgi:hypothetical protein